MTLNMKRAHNDWVLIADCGATKIRWQRLSSAGVTETPWSGTGMNPYHLPLERLEELLRESLPAEKRSGVASVHFYGAGCRANGAARMKQALTSCFPAGCSIEVQSDLLGAARALFGRGEGVCCILGTGAACGFYDGCRIVRQVPSLGYVLGDEGSGAALGRRLVADVLQGVLPPDVCRRFMAESGLTQDEILDRVYHSPEAARFLAAQVSFLQRNLHRESAVRRLVEGEFSRFVERNLNVFCCDGRPVHVGFVGGVAAGFADVLTPLLEKQGFVLAGILADPMPGLVAYHIHQLKTMNDDVRQ